MSKGSIMWDFFSKTSDNRAKCNFCSTTLSRSGGASTSNLKKHLEAKHSPEYADYMHRAETESKEPSTSRKSNKTERETAKDEVKVQLSLAEALNPHKYWPSDDSRTERVDKAICEMIALDDLPFSHVEDLGFMRLMTEVNSRYKLKGRKFYTEKTMELCERLRTVIANDLKKSVLNGVSLTTDIWSNQYESLFSLTAHLITDEFTRVKYVLHAQPLGSDRHTAVNLAAAFRKMLDNWDIEDDSIHLVLRDSGSNITKALQDLELNSTSCFAHDLNLVVQKALGAQKIVINVVNACKSIATHFHKSDPARKKLFDIQHRLNSEKVPLKVIQESPTRWNSTYDMLSRILELKEAIALYASEQNTEEWSLNWSLLPKIIRALKPIKEATEQISGSHSTAADVIPTVKYLNIQLEKRDEVDEFGVGSFMDCARSELERRFASVENKSFYYVATFLDPRYKDKMFIKSDTIDAAKSAIRKLADSNDVKLVDQALNKKRKLSRDNSEPSCKSWSDFFGKSSSESESEKTSEENDIEQELEAYTKSKRLTHDEDPLLWWKEKSKNLPVLASIAKQYLAAPATSVPSEQLFSGAGIIYDPLRNRLHGEKAERLLFLKYNLPGTKFAY